MWRKVLLVFPPVALGSCLLFGAAAVTNSKGVINNDGTQWEVKYHKDQKSPCGLDAYAIRLKISPVTGSDTDITGSLTYWTATITDGSGVTKYDPASKRVVDDLKGTITSNKGDNDARKLQRFELSKAMGGGRTITVKGFHYTGRAKGNSKSKNRQDDQLVVRIKDLLQGRGTYGECDTQPPDEDVMTEESVPDTNPPDYNG